MIIIWKGRGILSVVVLVVAFVLFTYALPEKIEEYAFILAFFTSAIFSWFLGNRWNAKQYFIDEKEFKKVSVRPDHSLFWIGMQYWGIIFCFFAIFLLFQKENTITSGVIGLLSTMFLVWHYLPLWRAGQENRKEPVELKNTKGIKASKQEERNNSIEKVQESEEEKLRRRKEKEDPSRFMPK